MTRSAPRTSVKRVAVVGHNAQSLLRFRGPLIAAMTAARHRVLALAPDIDATTGAALEGIGARVGTFPLAPPGASPFANRRTATGLTESLAAFEPHVVLASGPKAAAMGTLAGRAAGAGHVVLVVNGLAALQMVDGGDTGGWLQARTVRRRNRKAIAAADTVVFHNPGDASALVAQGLLPANKPILVLPGSGIDLARYASAPLPSAADGLVFMMAARLVKATGVETYCEAARLVKARSPSARFVLAGPPGMGPDGLSPQALARFREVVEYAGPVADIRPLLAAAHVVVYPARGEGCPGVLLEAMSIGRPVITSTDPGCRQTVDERVNGCLVSPGSPQELAEAMQFFLRRPDLLPAMARASRLKAERRFDQRPVVTALLDACGLG